ncbi:MAG: hypothetical protein HYT80_10795, partial [Euryarchaeota archaeon]|nr:hypothetical protein [Euryarchaeota archaeon]
MADQALRVLLLAPKDCSLRNLDLRPRYSLEHINDPEAAVAKAQHHEFAAIVIEMTQPDETAWSVFDRFQVAHPEWPILVASRAEEETVGVRALRDGAQDYLVTTGLDAAELSRSVRFAIERHRMVRERQASLERLRELERYKTQFVNTAAHELNSPLTPVKLQLHLLKTTQAKGLDEKQAASLKIIDRNVDRLVGLVADILDAARLQADRLLVRKEPVDLHRLAVDAVESSREAAKRAGVELDLESRPGLILEADPDRISQVLFNLINNAVKFTPEGGR